jgi:hypothetical protein
MCVCVRSAVNMGAEHWAITCANRAQPVQLACRMMWLSNECELQTMVHVGRVCKLSFECFIESLHLLACTYTDTSCALNGRFFPEQVHLLKGRYNDLCG